MGPLLLSQNSLPVMVLVWFFNFQMDGGQAERFGPYLTEGTCEAVRAQVIGRFEVVSRRERRPSASACFKVSVQQTDQIHD